MKLDKYINIPHKDMDCFCLVHHFFKQELNRDIGHYSDQSFYKKWCRIPLPQIKKYDAVLLKAPVTGGFHFGVYVGDGQFLHTLVNQTSRLGKIQVYRNQIIGVYRWHD